MTFSSVVQQLQVLYQRHVVAHISQIADLGSDVNLLNDADERAIRLSLSNLFCSMGELRKFEISLLQNKDLVDWGQALSFYQNAINVSPFEGSLYRPLAQISQAQGDKFQTAYYLSLSLMSENSNHAARETLLEIFEANRTDAEIFPVVTALTRLSQQEHIDYFQPHFLAAAGIGYSRTSADTFPHHMERCRRHLSTTLQLLIIDILHELESGRGNKGDFTQYDHLGLLTHQSDNSRKSSCIESLFTRASELSDMIRQALIILISLLESISLKHNLPELYKSVNWKHTYSNGNVSKFEPNELPIDEKLVLEKRYAIQCLHKVQSIPGFLDLSRLLLGLISSLISSEGVGIGTRTGVTSNVQETNTVTSILLTATCSSVSLFFDWIDQHPEYHILSILDKTAWEQMESDLAIYLSTLSSLTKTTKIPISINAPWKDGKSTFEVDAVSCLLRADISLQGFLPLRPLFRERYENFIKIIGAYQPISEALQQPNLPLEDIFHVCDLSVLLSSLLNSFILVIYAHRCLQVVRSLCQKPITVGEPPCGIFFDKFRQAIYPSSNDSSANRSLLDDNIPNPPNCLCVIVYRPPMLLRSSGFMTSGFGGKTAILTEAEFLHGIRRDLAQDCLQPMSNENMEVPDKSFDNPNVQGAVSKDMAEVEERASSILETIPVSTESISNLSQEDTGEIFPEAISPNVDECSAKLDQKLSTPQQSSDKGLLRVNVPPAVVKKKNTSTRPIKLTKEVELPLIVIDTPNVAMRHGLNTKFSCRGIKLAIDFFHAAGHRVVAFLPVGSPPKPRPHLRVGLLF